MNSQGKDQRLPIPSGRTDDIRMDVSSLTEFLNARSGAWPWRELVGVFGHRMVEQAHRIGAIKQIREIVAYIPDTPREIVVARAHRGTLTCVSALAHWEVDLLQAPHECHVAIARNNHRRHTQDTVLHRVYDHHALAFPLFPEDKVATVMCALRCVKTQGEREVIVDSVLNKGLVSKQQLMNAIRERESAGVRAAIDFGEAKTRSPLETRARRILRDLGLRVETGVVIPRVGEVDMIVSAGDVSAIIELDGYQWHSNRGQFGEDRRRDRVVNLSGGRTFRFTWEDIEQGELRKDMCEYFGLSSGDS